MADGFDFPVGKPDAANYYMSRGFKANYHLGEDWNGLGGGNTDLGDPVYSMGNGIVVFAKDVRMGWGNVVIIRHAFLDRGEVKMVDSLYGHLDKIMVREGQQITRGQQVGTIGNNRGMYAAHLHFEVRKNLYIGINRSSFRRDLSNYHVPSAFISPRRSLPGSGRSTMVAMNTFDHSHRSFYQPSDGTALRANKSRVNEATADNRPAKPSRNFRVNRYDDLNSF